MKNITYSLLLNTTIPVEMHFDCWYLFQKHQSLSVLADRLVNACTVRGCPAPALKWHRPTVDG